MKFLHLADLHLGKKLLEVDSEISFFTKEITINGSFKKNDRYQLDELCEQILELY